MPSQSDCGRLPRWRSRKRASRRAGTRNPHLQPFTRPGYLLPVVTFRVPSATRREMARWGAVLYAAGSTLGIVTLLLPHGTKLDRPTALAMCLVGYAFAATLALLGERMPTWFIHGAVVASTVVVSV